MILTVNNDATRCWDPKDAGLLKNSEDIHLYEECGYFCLGAWKENERILHIHFSSYEGRDTALATCGLIAEGDRPRLLTDKERENRYRYRR